MSTLITSGMDVYVDILESKLKELTAQRKPVGLYEPIEHILSLGGKRLRPVMTLSVAEACGGEVHDAVSSAVAVEVFHNFTLVHDDIMDAAALRRGKPTVHKVYGENQAILSGDAMYTLCYDLLAQAPARHLPALMNCFNKAAREVMEGQQWDVEFETREDVTQEEYLKMIEYKTSVLIGAAAEMGAICAGAPEETQKAFYDFGLNLGIAFQIMDDLLDCYGEQFKVGKVKGGDILQDKKTILYIAARDNAKGDQLERFLEAMKIQDADTKVKEVTAMYDEIGVPTFIDELMNSYYAKAKSALERADVSEEKLQPVGELGAMIFGRDH